MRVPNQLLCCLYYLGGDPLFPGGHSHFITSVFLLFIPSVVSSVCLSLTAMHLGCKEIVYWMRELLFHSPAYTKVCVSLGDQLSFALFRVHVSVNFTLQSLVC